MPVSRVAAHSSLQLVLVVATAMSGDRSVRGGLHARVPGLEPRAALRATAAGAGPRPRSAAHRRGARGPGTAPAASCDTPLRLRRCCRSLKGATSPPRTHQQLAVEHGVEVEARRRRRESCRPMSSPVREIEMRLAAAARRSARGCRPISIRRRNRQAPAPPSRRPPARATASAAGTPARRPRRASARAPPARRTAARKAAPARARPPRCRRPRSPPSRPPPSWRAAPTRRRAARRSAA